MVHPDQLPAQLARRFRPEWRLVFFSAFGFGLLAHFYKMANWLPNWDSLVFRYDAQQMLQYGRYFLSLACGLSSYYDLPWLNLLLGLLFLAGSAVCVAAPEKAGGAGADRGFDRGLPHRHLHLCL